MKRRNFITHIIAAAISAVALPSFLRRKRVKFVPAGWWDAYTAIDNRVRTAISNAHGTTINNLVPLAYPAPSYQIDGKKRVLYSAYETDAQGMPIDNLDEVAITGNIVITSHQMCRLRRAKPKPEKIYHLNVEMFRSQVLNNPTWLDIAVIANEVTKDRKDRFVFLEGLEAADTIDGVPTYELILGS